MLNAHAFTGSMAALTPQPVAGGTAWDPANNSAFITLSGGNLVATATAGASNTTHAVCTSSKSTGKFYAEFTITNVASAGMGAGILDNTVNPDVDSMSADTHSVLYWDDGNVYQNGAALGAAQLTFTTGDVISMAVNVGSSLIWFRKNANLWNNSGGGDPATDSGGLTFTASTPVFPATRMDTSGDVLTANFGATAYAQSVPSGYGNW